MTSSPVTLSTEPTSSQELMSMASNAAPEGIDEALSLAIELGGFAPRPGGGQTRSLWEALATIAAIDLGVARAIEPHLDALAILNEAGMNPMEGKAYESSWGVFAAEGGPDPLRASHHGDHWTLSGTKPWCSLATRLDFALVTAHVDQERGLFAVDLHATGVEPLADVWHARGLTEVPSGPVRFTAVTGNPVGGPGWYLHRAGFAWGGIGVAACWYGGAVGTARTLFAAAGRTPDPLMSAHLGAVDAHLHSARSALMEAATMIDLNSTPVSPSILAKRVRAVVARTCEAVLLHSAHAMGPAPLALDGSHAKRVTDLELYIRQHHAEKDDASLGAALAANGTPPW